MFLKNGFSQPSIVFLKTEPNNILNVNDLVENLKFNVEQKNFHYSRFIIFVLFNNNLDVYRDFCSQKLKFKEYATMQLVMMFTLNSFKKIKYRLFKM